MKETDLHEPVKQWLEEMGCAVRSEINDFDMLGILEDQCTIAVELKKTLNLEVINQAVNRQKIADYVYIGIPFNAKNTRTKKYKMTLHTLRRLHIGLVSVQLKSSPKMLKVTLDAKPCDMNQIKSRSKGKKDQLMKEFYKRSSDYNIAGSTRTKIMTAYREQSLWIAYLLQKFGPQSTAQLKKRGSDPESTYGILYQNHYKWFERIERGVYGLTPLGANALVTYKSIVDYYVDKEKTDDIS